MNQFNIKKGEIFKSHLFVYYKIFAKKSFARWLVG